MPKALITGITSQDGSYLAEFLLAKGYEVHGIIRRAPPSHLPEHPGARPGMGPPRTPEAPRRANGKARFYQASSSEMFGAPPPPQNEKTPFYPRSPYGAANVSSYWMRG